MNRAHFNQPDPAPEFMPTFTLDQHIAEARAEYDAKHGKGAWKAKCDAEWAEAVRIEDARRLHRPLVKGRSF